MARGRRGGGAVVARRGCDSAEAGGGTLGGWHAGFVASVARVGQEARRIAAWLRKKVTTNVHSVSSYSHTAERLSSRATSGSVAIMASKLGPGIANSGQSACSALLTRTQFTPASAARPRTFHLVSWSRLPLHWVQSHAPSGSYGRMIRLDALFFVTSSMSWSNSSEESFDAPYMRERSRGARLASAVMAAGPASTGSLGCETSPAASGSQQRSQPGLSMKVRALQTHPSNESLQHTLQGQLLCFVSMGDNQDTK